MSCCIWKSGKISLLVLLGCDKGNFWRLINVSLGWYEQQRIGRRIGSDGGRPSGPRPTRPPTEYIMYINTFTLIALDQTEQPGSIHLNISHHASCTSGCFAYFLCFAYFVRFDLFSVRLRLHRNEQILSSSFNLLWLHDGDNQVPRRRNSWLFTWWSWWTCCLNRNVSRVLLEMGKNQQKTSKMLVFFLGFLLSSFSFFVPNDCKVRKKIQ